MHNEFNKYETPEKNRYSSDSKNMNSVLLPINSFNTYENSLEGSMRTPDSTKYYLNVLSNHYQTSNKSLFCKNKKFLVRDD